MPKKDEATAHPPPTLFKHPRLGEIPIAMDPDEEGLSVFASLARLTELALREAVLRRRRWSEESSWHLEFQRRIDFDAAAYQMLSGFKLKALSASKWPEEELVAWLTRHGPSLGETAELADEEVSGA